MSKFVRRKNPPEHKFSVTFVAKVGTKTNLSIDLKITPIQKSFQGRNLIGPNSALGILKLFELF